MKPKFKVGDIVEDCHGVVYKINKVNRENSSYFITMRNDPYGTWDEGEQVMFPFEWCDDDNLAHSYVAIQQFDKELEELLNGN
jgi:hypothetical protein